MLHQIATPSGFPQAEAHAVHLLATIDAVPAPQAAQLMKHTKQAETVLRTCRVVADLAGAPGKGAAAEAVSRAEDPMTSCQR